MEDPILKFARNRWKKCLTTLLVILICGVSWIPKIDNKAEELIDKQLTQAAVTFAAVRSLNGLISVMQSTELSGQFIVGATVGVGEALDPLNDNIERLSWVMLASTTSLGIQKLINELIANKWMSWILTISGVIYLLLLWFVKKGISGWKLLSGKLFLSLSVLRYAVLLMVMFNHVLYLEFFDKEQDKLTEELKSNAKQIKSYHLLYLSIFDENQKNLKEQSESYRQEEESSWDKKVKSLWDKKVKSLWDKVKMNITSKAEKAFDKIINLIASFVLQTILLPLLFLWGITRLLKAIVAYSPSSPN